MKNNEVKNKEVLAEHEIVWKLFFEYILQSFQNTNL